MNNEVLNITKALAYTENGGQPDISNLKVGKTGEMKSMFQFEPGTWDAYSKQVAGQVLPMTPENESAVVYGKVNKWVSQGYTPEQIASMWNAGAGEPNAYTGKFSDGSSSSGINEKYGVKYDVPGYVNSFEKHLESFNTTPEGANQMSESTPSTISSTNAPITPENAPQQPQTPIQGNMQGNLPTPTQTPNIGQGGQSKGLIASAGNVSTAPATSSAFQPVNSSTNTTKGLIKSNPKKNKGKKK